MDTMPNANAGQLLRQYSQYSAQSKWPDVWASEISLRLQLRQAQDWEGLHPDSYDEIEFLRRSFIYSGQTDKFWSVIFAELNSEVMQNWLANTPADLLAGFWNWLTAAISAQSYEPRQLTFLINIYAVRFRDDFQALVQLLDHPTCEFLLARTSNLELRDMLQSRLTSLTRPDPWLEALTAAIPWSCRSFPTIYGDKLENIASAAKYLGQISPQSLHSFPEQTMASLWQGTEMLYKAGLLGDCLKLLGRIADPSDDYQLAVRGSDQAANLIQFERHLRRVLPIYAMLTTPNEPHRRCLALIRSNFPGFGIEPASLLYLDLGAVLLADAKQRRPYIRFEINQLAKDIAGHRPHDLVISFLTGDQEPDKLPILINEIMGRLETLPHESLVIMEVVLWLGREGRISLGRETSVQLASLLELFFAWIPAPELSPQRLSHYFNGESLVDAHSRGIRESSDWWNEQDDLLNDTAGQATNVRQRRQLLNKFLGVL